MATLLLLLLLNFDNSTATDGSISGEVGSSLLFMPAVHIDSSVRCKQPLIGGDVYCTCDGQ